MTRTCSRGIVALLTAVACSGGLVLGVAAPASSHTELIESTPREGSRISGAPAEIELEFNADVRPPFATVTLTIDERRVGNLTVAPGARPGALVARVNSAALPEDVAGVWRVAYRVTSDDGHPVAGTVTFEVRVGEASSSATQSAGSETVPSRSGADGPSDAIGATALIGLLAGLAAVLGCGVLVRARRRGDS